MGKYKNKLLNERQKTHGDFKEFSELYDRMMGVAGSAKCWGDLTPEMRTSARMIIFKLCRVLNGGHNHKDNWVDISGFADLISERMNDAKK